MLVDGEARIGGGSYMTPISLNEDILKKEEVALTEDVNAIMIEVI